MSALRLRQHIKASRTHVYRALTDARAVGVWMVPDGMASEVHTFDAREGGTFRISLTYEDPTSVGKTSAHTDTYHGRLQARDARRERAGRSILRNMSFNGRTSRE